jgi:hypothetical protein
MSRQFEFPVSLGKFAGDPATSAGFMFVAEAIMGEMCLTGLKLPILIARSRMCAEKAHTDLASL